MSAVLVTRPAGAEDPLAAALRERGYEVIAVPTVSTRRRDVRWPELARFDWVVVTSAAGAAVLPELPSGPRVAAVGAATAAALRRRGIEVGLVPHEASGMALARELAVADGGRVLLVRASAAAPDLPAELRRRGAVVEEVIAYETVEGPARSGPALRAAMDRDDLAAVVFASGSAARGYLSLGGDSSVPAVTIGPRTSEVARRLGFTVAAEAAEQDANGLAAAVAQAVDGGARRHA